MFDWDIESKPGRDSDCAPRFHAVKVKHGLGRWHTQGQASHASAEANGTVYDPLEAKGANEFASIRRKQVERGIIK